MDLRVVQAVVAKALALDRRRGSGLPPPPAYIEGAEGFEVDQPLQAYVMQVALASVAVLEESDATTLPAQSSLVTNGPSRPRPSDRLDEHASGPADVWLDVPVLYYIRTGLHHADTSANPEERRAYSSVLPSTHGCQLRRQRLGGAPWLRPACYAKWQTALPGPAHCLMHGPPSSARRMQLVATLVAAALNLCC